MRKICMKNNKFKDAIKYICKIAAAVINIIVIAMLSFVNVVFSTLPINFGGLRLTEMNHDDSLGAMLLIAFVMIVLAAVLAKVNWKNKRVFSIIYLILTAYSLVVLVWLYWLGTIYTL